MRIGYYELAVAVSPGHCNVEITHGAHRARAVFKQSYRAVLVARESGESFGRFGGRGRQFLKGGDIVTFHGVVYVVAHRVARIFNGCRRALDSGLGLRSGARIYHQLAVGVSPRPRLADDVLRLICGGVDVANIEQRRAVFLQIQSAGGAVFRRLEHNGVLRLFKHIEVALYEGVKIFIFNGLAARYLLLAAGEYGAVERKGYGPFRRGIELVFEPARGKTAAHYVFGVLIVAHAELYAVEAFGILSFLPGARPPLFRKAAVFGIGGTIHTEDIVSATGDGSVVEQIEQYVIVEAESGKSFVGVMAGKLPFDLRRFGYGRIFFSVIFLCVVAAGGKTERHCGGSRHGKPADKPFLHSFHCFSSFCTETL